MSERPHYNLQAWQVSMQLVKIVYTWSSTFPSEVKFGLLSQIRRAAISVPSNIAEGAASSDSKELVNWLIVLVLLVDSRVQLRFHI
jgi:four helix bundle protein